MCVLRVLSLFAFTQTSSFPFGAINGNFLFYFIFFTNEPTAYYLKQSMWKTTVDQERKLMG